MYSNSEFSCRFPDGGISKQIVITETETPRTESRKRNNTSGNVQVTKKKRNTSKSHPQSHSRHHKSQINSVQSVLASTKPHDLIKQTAKANLKPQPKSHVRPQQVSVNGDLSPNLKSNAEQVERGYKVKCKPGPKSQVGDYDGNLGNDDSDVVIVLHKPPNSLLDVIDMTDDTESPVEEVDESDAAEGLSSHILSTKIPGVCSIYTCCLCESTFTSKRYANSHVCKLRELNPPSPKEEQPNEETFEEKAPGRKASENKVQRKKTSEKTAEGKVACQDKAGGRNASDSKALENGEASRTPLSVSSELGRIKPETESKDSDSEHDTD
jgi:hypothetical protein